MKYIRMSIYLVLSMLCGAFCLAITEFVSFDRLIVYLGLILCISLPCFFYKTKFMLDNKLLMYYYIFIFLADYLGCLCKFYTFICWYDTFIHFIAGILIFILGDFILDKCCISKNVFFRIFFNLMFVMAVSCGWEIFEFSMDQIFNFDMQFSVISGARDTMEDMIMALIGGIFYCEILILKAKSWAFS